MNKRELFAQLPSVDEMLNQEMIINALNEYPRNILLEGIRESIEEKRREIVELKEENFDKFDITIDEVVRNTINKCNLKYSLSLKKVINATGTVLHTNLGRSLLSESIKDELWEAASRYSNLEYDIDKGQRGSRYTHLTDTIKRLTGAEDVLVVNNNAAAVLLVLSTMAKGGEAIVSRGELVEVGGSFRIPSIMALSGADLVEVGSTNKTHLKDYEEAINENTKVLMKVHTSNYRILGFTQSVDVDELCELGKKHDLPVIEDLGSGVFLDISKYGLSYEPTVLDSIRKGADVVTFSGDKMLGGPQAGIIVGKKEYIEKMKKNQLTRALRVDKLTICALEDTLRMYLDE
ncbi:MAG: L-seryl-tRNA(Sec) selenium transferase, partial [Peptostreptococcaceae bacterium]|nr:L-seryl-tRNA(Sec) selenium transferase [Peptostreptococcaceae bacterium]